jgi:hypothetical protein
LVYDSVSYFSHSYQSVLSFTSFCFREKFQNYFSQVEDRENYQVSQNGEQWKKLKETTLTNDNRVSSEMDRTNSEFLSDSSSYFPTETPLVTEDHHELEIISSHSEYEEEEEEKMEESTTSSTAVTSSLVFLESREDAGEDSDENALIKRIKNLFQSFTEDEEFFVNQRNVRSETSYVSHPVKKRNKSTEALQGNCRVCQREKIKCPVK